LEGFLIVIVIIASIIGLIRNIDRMSNNRGDSSDGIFRSFQRRRGTFDHEQAKRERKKEMLQELNEWENNESNLAVGSALEREGFDVRYEMDRSIESQPEEIPYPEKSVMELPDWVREERKKIGFKQEDRLKLGLDESVVKTEPTGIMGVPEWVKEGRMERGNMGINDEPTIIWKTYNVAKSATPERVEKGTLKEEKVSHIEVRSRQAAIDLDSIKDAVSRMDSELISKKDVLTEHGQDRVEESISSPGVTSFSEKIVQKSVSDLKPDEKPNAQNASDNLNSSSPNQLDLESSPREGAFTDTVDSAPQTPDTPVKPEEDAFAYKRTGKFDNLGSEEKILAWIDEFALRNIYIKFGFFDGKFDIPSEFTIEFKGDEQKVVDLVGLLKKSGLVTAVDDGEIFAYPFKKRIVLTSIGRERLGNYR